MIRSRVNHELKNPSNFAGIKRRFRKKLPKLLKNDHAHFCGQQPSYAYYCWIFSHKLSDALVFVLTCSKVFIHSDVLSQSGMGNSREFQFARIPGEIPGERGKFPGMGNFLQYAGNRSILALIPT